jgi:hypothetical protein
MTIWMRAENGIAYRKSCPGRSAQPNRSTFPASVVASMTVPMPTPAAVAAAVRFSAAVSTQAPKARSPRGPSVTPSVRAADSMVRSIAACATKMRYGPKNSVRTVVGNEELAQS